MFEDFKTYLKPIFLVGKFTLAWPTGLEENGVDVVVACLCGTPFVGFFLYCFYLNRTEMHLVFNRQSIVGFLVEIGIGWCSGANFFVTLLYGLFNRRVLKKILCDIQQLEARNMFCQNERDGVYLKLGIFSIVIFLLSVYAVVVYENIIHDFKIFYFYGYSIPSYISVFQILVFDTILKVIFRVYRKINRSIVNFDKRYASLVYLSEIHFQTAGLTNRLNDFFTRLLLPYFAFVFITMTVFLYIAGKAFGDVLETVQKSDDAFFLLGVYDGFWFAMDFAILTFTLRSWNNVAKEVSLFICNSISTLRLLHVLVELQTDHEIRRNC